VILIEAMSFDFTLLVHSLHILIESIEELFEIEFLQVSTTKVHWGNISMSTLKLFLNGDLWVQLLVSGSLTM
jgi:hypothetical protein